MPIHKLKLLSSKEVSRDTFVFSFEKPTGFTFVPGQYGGFTHCHATDTANMTRRFSLLSIPDDSTIMIATRMQPSPYKQALKTLQPGAEIKFAGPTGNFVLHEDASIPAVFIAGGIGITPFYSMIRHACQHQPSRKITLFYGNQSVSDAAFLNELLELQQENINLQCIFTMAMPDAAWSGEIGFISYDMIKRYVSDLSKPIFYICGSPAMVKALSEILDELDIAKERTKIEDFPGY